MVFGRPLPEQEGLGVLFLEILSVLFAGFFIQPSDLILHPVVLLNFFGIGPVAVQGLFDQLLLRCILRLQLGPFLDPCAVGVIGIDQTAALHEIQQHIDHTLGRSQVYLQQLGAVAQETAILKVFVVKLLVFCNSLRIEALPEAPVVFPDPSLRHTLHILIHTRIDLRPLCLRDPAIILDPLGKLVVVLQDNVQWGMPTLCHGQLPLHRSFGILLCTALGPTEDQLP